MPFRRKLHTFMENLQTIKWFPRAQSSNYLNGKTLK